MQEFIDAVSALNNVIKQFRHRVTGVVTAFLELMLNVMTATYRWLVRVVTAIVVYLIKFFTALFNLILALLQLGLFYLPTVILGVYYVYLQKQEANAIWPLIGAVSWALLITTAGLFYRKPEERENSPAQNPYELLVPGEDV